MTIGELNKKRPDIIPVSMYDIKSLLLYSILSLASNKKILELVNKNFITITKTKRFIRNSFLYHFFNIFTKIDALNANFLHMNSDDIYNELRIHKSSFNYFSTYFIHPQIFSPQFYEYLNLISLTIEDFGANDKKIGFYNYIDFSQDFKINKGNYYNYGLSLVQNEVEYSLKLATLDSKEQKDIETRYNKSINTYPELLIINNWEDDLHIDKTLYDKASKCEIEYKIDDKDFTKLTIGKQEYKLISVISTNYSTALKKFDTNNPIPQPIIKKDINPNKHSVIYLFDDNKKVYTYNNYSYYQNTGLGIILGLAPNQHPCLKIKDITSYNDNDFRYKLKINSCDVDEINNDDDEKTGLNFSPFKGTRTSIYVRIDKSTVPAKPVPAKPGSLAAVIAARSAPTAAAPGSVAVNKKDGIGEIVKKAISKINETEAIKMIIKKKQGQQSSSSDQSPPKQQKQRRINNSDSIDNEKETYLKTIEFKKNKNELLKDINSYFKESVIKLLEKMGKQLNDEIKDIYKGKYIRAVKSIKDKYREKKAKVDAQ